MENDMFDPTNLSHWLQYSPEKAIKHLCYDVRTYIGMVKSMAEIISIHQNTKSISFGEEAAIPTLVDAMKILVDEGEKLRSELDTVADYAEKIQ
jgi:hypothetical protein